MILSKSNSRNIILSFHNELKTVEYNIQKINIPGLSISPVEIKTMFGSLFQKGDNVKFEPIKASVIIDEEFKTFKELYDCIVKSVNPITGVIVPNHTTYNIKMSILNNFNIPIIILNFKEAWISSFGDKDMDFVASEDMTTQISIIYNSYEFISI